ncbi:MAG: hypothetical protein ACHQ51_11205 [Elusimicrobiota bacterium]
MKPLNPLMAALLVASSASFVLPRNASANGLLPHPATASPDASTASTAGCLDKIKDETDPRNAMTCLVATQEGAAKDIGERFAAFIQGKDFKGRGYLTDKLRQDAKLLPLAVAEAKNWPEKNKNKPTDVAILYLVLGPGDGGYPAWTAASPVLTKTKDLKTTLRQRLEIALASAQWTSKKKIPQSGVADAVDSFLIDASSRAYTVFGDTRTTAELKISIDVNDVTSPVAPTVGDSRHNALDTSGAGFGYNDLYVNGAVVQDVWGSKDDGFRRISMKMYTIKQADGSLQNMIGIVDITPGDPNTPYAPKFIPMTQSGDSTLSLQDGGRKYKISIGMTGNEHTVSFARPDGQALNTSLEKLAMARADQAASGGIVNIPSPDGPQFYAMGQGGTNGSVLFFPKADVDNRASSGDARYLRPVAMGNVTKVDNDGLTVPMDGKPDIGSIDGKPYHFEFDRTSKSWKVVDGKGDVTPPPASAAAAAPAKPAAAAGPAGDQTGDQTDQAATPTVPDGSTLEQALALATQAGWAEAAGNKGLSDEARAKVRIMTILKDKNRYFNVFFDNSLGVPGGQYAFALTVGDKDPQPLKNIRGFGNYVILEYPNSKQYFTYQDLAQYVQRKDSHPLILDPKIGMQNVTDVGMALDMLTHYFTLTAAEKAKLLNAQDGLAARVLARANGAGYVINGNGQVIYMNSGEEGVEIWPTLVKPGDKGDNTGMTGLRGPGTAVSVAGGAPAAFTPTIEMPGNRVATLVKGDGHIAIYSGKEDEMLGDGKAVNSEVWYVMTEYLKGDYTGDAEKDKAAAVASRTKLLPVFGGQKRFKLPASYEMQSLAGVVLPDSTQLMLLHGSTEAKGAIAAYRFALPDNQGGQNVRGKAGNCGGAVIWWGGVTKEQVQKACLTDSKIP